MINFGPEFAPACFPTSPTTGAGFWDDVYANIEKEIRESDDPPATYSQYLILFSLLKYFSEKGLLHLVAMKGDITREVQHSKPKEEDCEKIRGHRQKSHDDGNSSYKERGVEDNC